MSTVETDEVQCAVCGHLTMAESVSVTLWFGSQLTVVEGVPAHVCPNCRARSYDAEADRRLNSLIAAGFPDWKMLRVIQTPVFAYDQITDFAEGGAERLPLADGPADGRQSGQRAAPPSRNT